MLDHSYLKEILHYEPETGVWTWKIEKGRKKPGDRAGSTGHLGGYRMLKIDQTPYLSGRLAHFYMTKRWPLQIDHINRKPSDDRWVNLREVTPRENCANRYNRASKRRKHFHLPTGVCHYGKKYVAKITTNYVCTKLGTYDTPEQASTAYQNALKEVAAQ